jgi:transcriptional regulator with XRE-family HTH domain
MSKLKATKRTKAVKAAKAKKAFSVIRNISGSYPTKVLPKTARNADFGVRLRGLLDKKKVQQSEIADKLKIGRDSMSGYARGKIMPLADRLEAIAKFLDVEPTELVPDYGQSISKTEAAPRFNMNFHEDGTAWVAINQRLPKALALAINRLMEEHGIS